ncbi:hypothetical protein LIER_16063 [Lithospermum erythrorhizon]|uniref:Kinesin-like protein n=1 Tax=Lithospermum erythrorhizon TaxID=34254 RepID=A0AAV3Q7N8_LITER
MEKICVTVRVRPAKPEESSTNPSGYKWKIEEKSRISLHKSLGSPISGVSYAFDHVFDQDCTNSQVYELVTKDIINAAVDGFNGTAFAYGQTSSGKTFTMNGSENDPGIIHRAVNDIFTKIHTINDREFLVRVSYMEIYNEEINDLFAIENKKLQIHESLERGVFVSGLKEDIVNSADQVLKLFQLGEANRHFGETNMNIKSSRSHTIFRMVIESKTKDPDCRSSVDDAIRVSVLNLVDLAGSERIAKTGAEGVRLKEGKHINKSLMALGNVINKLSEGTKQRGHIPYRDSKLTRILQPALGGNAKTSIICTVAPEEAHVEETKGTLQFASRAKRITNCVQVNEILSDAALLKRQRLEIEELRQKLQGSRAEVLEQEVLNLRNEMLKYELEHEKLATELEVERRSHKDRDQCIREQQMKIDNLSSLVNLSESDRSSSLVQKNPRQCLQQSFDNRIMFQEDALRTPCFKANPNGFVAKRSDYTRQPEFSPLPDAFSDFADEDMWMKMNRGYIADLDSLQIASARKFQSISSINSTDDVSMDDFKRELQDIRSQLEVVTGERDHLRGNLEEEISLNSQLMQKLDELQQEALLIQDIPQKLCQAVTICKDLYRDILSNLQTFIADDKSGAAKLLSSSCEIGASLFSVLESHFSIDDEEHKSMSTTAEDICKRLNSTIYNLVISDAPLLEEEIGKDPPADCKTKVFTLLEDVASWKQKVEVELQLIKGKCQKWEEELNAKKHLVEMSNNRYESLEREFHTMKEERDMLLQRVSNSCQSLALVTEEKEKALQDLNTEKQRRNRLEEEIKQFRIAFASRQRSFKDFQSGFKSMIENMKAQSPVSIPKALG